jgi:hypothetical protein
MSKKTEVEAGGESPVDHGVPQGSTLPWYQQPNLRELYLLMVILFLGSSTLGYDGSLLNGLQTMTSWQDCEYHALC